MEIYEILNKSNPKTDDDYSKFTHTNESVGSADNPCIIFCIYKEAIMGEADKSLQQFLWQCE